MFDYRLYLLDRGGHVNKAIELSEPSDADAICRASGYRTDGGSELWNLARRVQIFPPTSAVSGPEVERL